MIMNDEITVYCLLYFSIIHRDLLFFPLLKISALVSFVLTCKLKVLRYFCTGFNTLCYLMAVINIHSKLLAESSCGVRRLHNV
jgi:hypothetical protein